MKPNVIFAALTATLLVAAFALVGCSDQQHVPAAANQADDVTVSAPQDILNELAEFRRIAAEPDGGLGHWTSATDAPPVELPAGSVNGLAAAVAAAGPNGTVIVKAGIHTEHNTVTINHRVSIIGENGATLMSAVPHHNGPTIIVSPAVYVHNASHVKIWNIDFRPTGSVGGTAIMLEDAPQTTVGASSFEEFQFAVLLQNSHSSTITGNRVVANFGWTTGDPIECDGIININGAKVRIADNEISQGLLGVFCSGSDGFFLSNNVHDNFVGMILCKVPAASFELPSGDIVGSVISAKNWFVQGNAGSGNFYCAYMVIDGANGNRLVNNGASASGVYDLELLGETCLFGFPTPTSFNNNVVVGSHQNIIINDFGVDNRVIGNVSVTHNISAPCP